MLNRRALITGVGSQDGSYLAELLVAQGYEVFGIVRHPGHYPNLDGVRDHVELIEADPHDQPSLVRALRHAHPGEVCNFASVSFVPLSWREPVLTAQFAAVGVTSILEAIREVDPSIRFYQASSSEIFGEPREVPQSEKTPLSPLTPYGVARAYGHFITASYRRAYGMHASSGILYNHESPRRPSDSLPQKIARAVAGIKLGLQEELVVGDLDARRDWGFCRRLRAGDVAHAPAGRALGLRHRFRGDAQRPRVRAARVRACRSRLATICPVRRGSPQREGGCMTSSAIRGRRGRRSDGVRPSRSPT
jgi:GDPmannose 4,6-dehydratase